MQIRR